MIIKGLLLIGILLLPGLVTFPYVKKKAWDFFETPFIILLISVLVVSILGVILAELSVFSLPRLLALSGFYCLLLLAGVLFIKKLRVKEWTAERAGDITPSPTLSLSHFLFICILLLALGLGSYSFEYILGGRDPGVYINTGINLAHTGSLIIQDKLLEGMDTSQQELFYKPAYYNYAKYPGFFGEGSTILPQFLPLFSVWIAIFYLTLGLKGALGVSVFFGILGIYGVYLAGRQIFNPLIGLLSALLLTVNATQIWYMRYPSPEVLLQFLIFAGIYAYDRYQRETNGWLGAVSAVALGLTLLVKPLAFLLLIPIGLYVYGKTSLGYTPLDGYFIFPFMLNLLHAILHIYWFNSYYMLGHLERLRSHKFLISLLIALGILFWLSIKLSPRLRILVSQGIFTSPYFRLSLSILLIALSLYAYFIRPQLAQEVYHPEMARLDRDYAMDSLVHLGWYLSPVAIFLGVLGACLFIHNRLDRVNLFFLLIGLTFSFSVLKGTEDAWDHFWIMRRFVPVVIPVFLLFTAYALWHLFKFHALTFNGTPQLPKLIFFVVLIFLLTYSLVIARPILTHREYSGIIRLMDQIAEIFPGNAVVVMDNFDVTIRIAPPLEYIYQKKALVLYQNTLESYQKFIQLAHRWMQEGQEVYFVTPLPQGLGLTKKFTLKVPEMEYAVGHLPKKINELYSDLYVYRLTEKDGASKYLLKLGINDFGLIEGFYHIEDLPDGNRKYRWTKGTAKVLVPGESKFRIRMRAWRPDFLPKVNMEVFTKNTLAAVIQLLTPGSSPSDFQDYEVVIPANLIEDPLTLTLVVPTWNPKDALNVPDLRDLGVMIEEIEVIK